MKEEMDMEVDFCLPPKDRNVVPFRGAAETTCKANLFRMELDPSVTVYKYRVDLMKNSKDKEVDLTKGIKSDVAVQHRRRVCRSIFEDAVKLAEKNGSPWVEDKHMYVYDCANILYSCKPLQCFQPGAEEVATINLTMDDVKSQFSKSFLGRKCESVIIKIMPTLTFSYSTATISLDKHRETQQFLEVLTSAMLYKNGDHFVFGNKFYCKSSKYDADIGEGKCIKSGFEKNVRIGEDHGASFALVQIDAKKSPFFRGDNVIDFSMQYLGSRYEDAVEKLDPRSQKNLSDQLKGLVAKTKHTDKDNARYVRMSGLAKERVIDVSFPVNEQEETTMVDFFKNKYTYPLKHTRTPCVTEKGAKKTSLYPMEVLDIERGQRVNCQKASKNLGEKQIKECRMDPAVLKDYIQDALDECLLNKDNKYLQNFKVKVYNAWEPVAAKIMHPPAIRYGQHHSVEPTRDGTLNWKLGNRELFLRPGTITRMLFIIFDRCVNRGDVGYFLDKLLRAANDHGMRVPNPRDVEIDELSSEDTTRLSEAFQYLLKDQNTYLMCITRQKFDPVHDTVKSFEARYGIVTQHICEQTFKKAIGQQGAFMVINNLLLKLNQKAGGVNHGVALSRVFFEVNKTSPDTADRIIAPNRMIFGFDVSHAGPQSFSERALGQRQSDPSVVGMSYSISHATELCGVYWFQEPRFAGIDGIAKQVADAIVHRRSITNTLPDDIVVFRGGVSEGEFDKVAQEIEELKKAFLLAGGPTFHPSITAIVVLTKSNYRILPERIDSHARAMDQNVRPGTVISSAITNPHYNEFILVSQKGIMGTVRPTRCVLVTVDPGTSGVCLNCEEAQQLTYALAFGHQIVCASTTLPVPLTAATMLSKRGRNNWKTANYTDSDARSVLSGGSGDCGQLKHDGSEGFFNDLSEQLASKLKHHYWA